MTMRVLLAARQPGGDDAPIGGVQSWIATVARELRARGHAVTIWGPMMSEPDGTFDVGFFAHIRHTNVMIHKCNKSVIVSHGIIEDEQPAFDLPAIFTSEEVRRHWGKLGPIVRQPIDLAFWKPSPAETRHGLTLFSYRAPNPFGMDRAAEKLGMPFRWIREGSPEEVREELRKSAVVLASGRAALESMACNTPTLICDWRPYNGGPLLCQSFNEARKHNYSGRGGVDPSTVDMTRIIREAQRGRNQRRYVIMLHAVSVIVDNLLSAVQAVC